MSYLLDTNVLSELKRKNPNAGVVEWFTRRPASTLFLSVLTSFFTGRILTIDADVANIWGRLIANHARPLPAIDSLLGATAAKHGLSMVTRNARDFEGLGIEVINPWTIQDGAPIA